MAHDNLVQLGSSLSKTQNNIGFSRRRVGRIFPRVEKLNDFFASTILTYKMEFVEHGHEAIFLSIFIKEDFNSDEVSQKSLIPLTISHSGLSVGLAGKIGSEDIWYPLAYLGDLNFRGQFGLVSYSAVFDIQTYLSNISAYKIEFRGGAVDVTSVTTVTATTITVPLTQAKLRDPGDYILYGAYVYGKVLSIDASGWLYYADSRLYRSDSASNEYTPHLINI